MNGGTCTNDNTFYEAAGSLTGTDLKKCVNFLYKIGDTESNDIPTIAENMAKSFYKQMSDYDFTTNKAKTGKEYGDVNQFTAMIWKGTDAAAHNMAAFAIQSGCAAARFCAETNKPNTAGASATADQIVAAYKTMVLPRCIDDNDVNTCFAADLLKSINQQRNLRADTDPVKADADGDKAIAKAIKDIFANSPPTNLSTFTTQLKEQMDINSSYKNC